MTEKKDQESKRAKQNFRKAAGIITEKKLQGQRDSLTLQGSLGILKNMSQGPTPVALKLHLELIGNNLSGSCYSGDDDKGFTELHGDELQILQDFGRVEQAISRDVIVPGDMTWHALSYAIQRLFGWQNSHLHNFEFLESAFTAITGNDSFANYLDMCGLVFRFPHDDYKDIYWDDDYNGYEDLKVWMRGKYSGPYRYGGSGELYPVAQFMARGAEKQMPILEVRESFAEYHERTKNSHKVVPQTDENGEISLVRGYEPVRTLKAIPLKDATTKEVAQSVHFESPFNQILERLKITDLLLPEGKECPDPDVWRHAVMAANYYLINLLDEKNLAGRQSDPLLLHLEPLLFPAVDEIIYAYDYGDNWHVSIRMTDCFVHASDGGYRNAANKRPDAALAETIGKVVSGEVPVCVAADGLKVLDDVGGLHGYCEFLRAIKAGNPSEIHEHREWARERGWTGRKVKPENML